MAKIFISYRRADSGYIAAMIQRHLISVYGPDSVFLDIDDIPLGVDFRTHIDEAISQCDVVLALMGAEWLTVTNDNGKRRIDDETDFVRIELETALKREIPVVPVLTESAVLPSSDVLPESLSALAYRNASELRSGRDLQNHLEVLSNGISRILRQRWIDKGKPPAGKFERYAGSASPKYDEVDVSGPPGFLRKLLLLYQPTGFLCWILHLLFYFGIVIAVVSITMTSGTIDVEPPGKYVVVSLSIVMMSLPFYLMFWWPARVVRARDLRNRRSG